MRRRKIKEGDLVFVYKGEKGEEDPKEYIAIVKHIANFDYGTQVTVEFLGGKKESLPEDEVVRVSNEVLLRYILDNLIIPLRKSFNIIKHDFDAEAASEFFLEISEIIRNLIR